MGLSPAIAHDFWLSRVSLCSQAKGVPGWRGARPTAFKVAWVAEVELRGVELPRRPVCVVGTHAERAHGLGCACDPHDAGTRADAAGKRVDAAVNGQRAWASAQLSPAARGGDYKTSSSRRPCFYACVFCYVEAESRPRLVRLFAAPLAQTRSYIEKPQGSGVFSQGIRVSAFNL